MSETVAAPLFVTPDSIRGPGPQAPPSPGFPRIGVRGRLRRASQGLA